MKDPALILITGVMAAGKSTVAQAVAETVTTILARLEEARV